LPIFGAAQCATAAERLAVGARFDLIFEQGADGQWQGLGVDVVRTLAARAGDTVRFDIYPWARAQAMVQRAQADILIGPYKSPQRDKQFAFVDLPFYRDRMVFYARSGAKSPWEGRFGQLDGTRIAAVRGWHYGARFDQARPRLNISEVNQLENGVQMLLHGRVDLLATNERNSAALIGTMRASGRLVPLCPVVAQLDGYLAFPRGAAFTALRDQYSALFTEMVRSGEFARLAARHGVLAPAVVAADGSLREVGARAATYNKPCPAGPADSP
jgi:polar amino acid transport system substrate-binding protein